MDPAGPLKLFSEFPPIATSEWETKIFDDLKGADYEKKLVWKSGEGFNIKPYYRVEDLQSLEYLNVQPADYPYLRGNKKTVNDWLIRVDFFSTDIEEANRQALESISRGADAVGFDARELTTHKQLRQLLDKIELSKTNINFFSSRSYPLTLELLSYEVTSRGEEPEKIKGSINFDPISYLLLHGDFYINWRNNLEEAEYLLNASRKYLPDIKILTVNGHYFQDAGSTLVQEVAFTLASACEYIVGLTGKGFSIDKIAQQFLLSFGAGSNYFMEIAKHRAARFLWAKMVEQFHPENSESLKIFIHTSTAAWNKTLYDPYVNLLRTTTEGMSAALGNTDSITIRPFDLRYKKPDEFSRRMALNQQLIFKEESYLDKIVDPAAGSYYLENLTDAIISHAWNLFLEVEEKGGIIEAIKSGFIQGEIQKAREQKEADIDRRKIVMIGTNQYPNLQEKVIDNIGYPEWKSKENQSAYLRIPPYKGSQAFDEIRLATEKFIKRGNKKPSVFLFTMGNLSMLRARAGFVTNFFGCAGYEIIDNTGFQSIDEGVNAALGSNSEIIVICSSDEEYPAIVPEICEKIKATGSLKQILVAGYPKNSIDVLQKAGINDFIHTGSILLATLKKYQTMLGIE